MTETLLNPPVPWYNMDYEQASKAKLVEKITDHLNFELTPDKADDYRKYLHHHCNFPSDFGRVKQI